MLTAGPIALAVPTPAVPPPLIAGLALPAMPMAAAPHATAPGPLGISDLPILPADTAIGPRQGRFADALAATAPAVIEAPAAAPELTGALFQPALPLLPPKASAAAVSPASSKALPGNAQSVQALPVTVQPWALSLVPELGNLPAAEHQPLPATATPAVARQPRPDPQTPWPPRPPAMSTRPATLASAANPEAVASPTTARPRGWQASLPAAAPLAAIALDQVTARMHRDGIQLPDTAPAGAAPAVRTMVAQPEGEPALPDFEDARVPEAVPAVEQPIILVAPAAPQPTPLPTMLLTAEPAAPAPVHTLPGRITRLRVSAAPMAAPALPPVPSDAALADTSPALAVPPRASAATAAVVPPVGGRLPPEEAGSAPSAPQADRPAAAQTLQAIATPQPAPLPLAPADTLPADLPDTASGPRPDLPVAASAPPLPRPVRRDTAEIAITEPLAATPALPAAGPLPTVAAPPPAVLPPAASLSAAPVPDMAAVPPEQGFFVASDRLGAVRIDVSGSPDALSVSLSATPSAAPLLAGEALRLAQDLAATGMALASYAVNGQRADVAADTGGLGGAALSGNAGGGSSAGQPQRPPGQPSADMGAAVAPRFAPMPGRQPINTDRFA